MIRASFNERFAARTGRCGCARDTLRHVNDWSAGYAAARRSQPHDGSQSSAWSNGWLEGKRANRIVSQQRPVA